MNIDNITRNEMTLDNDGKAMQIKIYEKEIDKLQQENKQLKLELLEKKCSDKDFEYKKRLKIENNWNKLKEILPNVSKHYKNQFQLFSANCCEHILEIMQELEKGDSNE